ncbi:MAG: hypothetical protein AAGD33_10920 [Actinomycetota bacterium]
MEFAADPAHARLVVDPVRERGTSPLPLRSPETGVGVELVDDLAQVPGEAGGGGGARSIGEFVLEVEQFVATLVVELRGGVGEGVDVFVGDPPPREMTLDVGSRAECVGPPFGLLGLASGRPLRPRQRVGHRRCVAGTVQLRQPAGDPSLECARGTSQDSLVVERSDQSADRRSIDIDRVESLSGGGERHSMMIPVIDKKTNTCSFS